jgi:hypothetical protein
MQQKAELTQNKNDDPSQIKIAELIQPIAKQQS